MLSGLFDPLAYDFFLRALAAAAIVGLVCAVVGSYMVLRGLAFMGDALSHASFPGVVVAYLVGGPFYIGAAVASKLGGPGWLIMKPGDRASFRDDLMEVHCGQ